MRGLAVVSVAAALLVAGLAGPPAADAAATGCTAADPAPQVLGVTATDVVLQRQAVRTAAFGQTLRVTARFTCGGGYEYQGCSFDPVRPCTTADVAMRRTAAATSAAALRCGRFFDAYDNAAGSTPYPTPTSDTDVYVVGFAERWETHDDSDDFQPGFTNACAGAWDVTATVGSTWQDGGSRSAPLTHSRAFSVRRWSHLTADAGPEPVRAGGLVTVRGRLVRADWSLDRNVAYAGRPVQLQRRTGAGAYRTLRTVRADRYGRLRTTLRALADERCYRWVFTGSSTTASAVSFGDCVRVRS